VTADRWSVRFLMTRAPVNFYGAAFAAGVLAFVEVIKGHRGLGVAFATTAALATLCGQASASLRASGSAATGGSYRRAGDALVVGLLGASLAALILAVLGAMNQ
jgi:hypothetical protein